jgi:hypothetical protein
LRILPQVEGSGVGLGEEGAIGFQALKLFVSYARYSAQCGFVSAVSAGEHNLHDVARLLVTVQIIRVPQEVRPGVLVQIYVEGPAF